MAHRERFGPFLFPDGRQLSFGFSENAGTKTWRERPGPALVNSVVLFLGAHLSL
jgi:hypothetical protein